MMNGWRKSTLRQYDVYLKKWIHYCKTKNNHPLERNVNCVLQFLKHLYTLKYSYSAINTARSALSVIFDSPPIGDTPLVSRFLKAVYNLRPNLPKYSQTWSVSTVLKHLESLSPVRFLSLQVLSHKLATLLALVTGQRLQTLHALDLKFCVYEKDCIVFNIQSLLKHSTPANKTSNCVYIHAYPDNKKICPMFLLKYYIKRTEKLRKDSMLFINHMQPHNPISKDTLSRWVKISLQKAGINTTKFKVHSTRSASTSAAAAASVDINTILKAASWTNSNTFAKHYNKPIINNTYSKAILKTLQ